MRPPSKPGRVGNMILEIYFRFVSDLECLNNKVLLPNGKRNKN